MKRKNIRKKKNNLFLLVLLVLGISVGYAILSTTLNITGIAGIKENTWDIHWENVVPNSSSTVTTETPVISEHATKVSFGVTLELPGDFYEFDVDAKNDGTIPGTITKILPNIYKVVESEEEDNTLPDFIKVSIVYKDTNIEPRLGDILDAGEKQTYTIRVEYDKDATELPDKDISIKVEEDITYSQYDTKGKYVVKFDPNGGSVTPNRIEVTKGEKIGSLPVPTYAEHQFIGWFTELTDGTKIDANTIPTGNVKYYAHWTSSYAIFDTGENVNTKFKQLAGNSSATSDSVDSSITAVRKSTIEPSASNKTAANIVSIEGSEPIYAWFDNGTIYWWSAADYVYLNQNASNMFYNLTTATYIDTDFYTNITENMSGMFARTGATSLDLSNFDTSNVVYMTGMFGMTNVTSLDLTSFDTSNVVYMTNMFSGCKATEIDLSSFDTSKVEDMSSMFAGSSVKDLDISNFNIENLSYMSGMFQGSGIETIDMSGWNYKKITYLSSIFQGSNKIKSIDMSNSDFGSVNYFSYVFQGLSTLEYIGLNNVKTPNFTSLDSAFQGCSGLVSLDLSSFDTSNVTSMSSTFYGCTSLTSLDLTSFDTIKVIYMSSMFTGCINVTTITVSDTWTTAYVQNSSGMFTGCSKLVGGSGTVFDSNHIDKEYAHYDYGSVNPGYFNKRNAGKEYTVTFHANGGDVSFNTKKVRQYNSVGELPSVSKDNTEFGGWYDAEGEEVTEDTVPIDDLDCYANWLPKVTVTYDANEGDFNNNKITNVIEYENKEIEVTEYSHTSNIDDTGVATGEYSPNLATNDIVTIDGANSIDIEVWYSTENNNYNDWLSIYPKGVDPTKNNYSEATISNGKLYGGASTTKPSDDSNYHKTYHVDDDTAQFFFTSNGFTNYYGYYAIITGTGKYYIGDKNYIEPIRDNYVFTGWKDSKGNIYKNEDDVKKSLKDIKGIKEANVTLYAQWKEIYTVTFNANGGSVSPTSVDVVKGNTIGDLPVPTMEGHVFEGWYYPDTLTGIKVTKNYVPNSSLELYARWDETGAIFDTGKNVNVKFKQLVDPEATVTDQYTEDLTTLAIKKSTTAPASGITTVDVSADGSLPIYAWFDSTDDTIYWYTTADKVYTNEDASYMFGAFKAVTEIDTSFDTSLSQNMEYMFEDCQSLRSIDVSGFNTSNATNISYMFYGCGAVVSLDTSSFDTSNVINFYSVFAYTGSLREVNISNWDLSNYNTDYVVRKLFGYDNRNIQVLYADNVIFPQVMDHAFADFENLEYLSLKNVDTSRTTTFQYMFDDVKTLEYLDLSDFDTENVVDMSYMFYECLKIKEINVNGWDTRNVTTLRAMFYDCYELKKIDLSSFNTSKVTDMAGMLGYCKALEEANLSNFDFRKYNAVSLMSNIFTSANTFTKLKIVILDNTKYGTTMQRAFAGFFSVETLSLRNVDTSLATTMYYAFQEDTSIKHLYLDSFDTRNVRDMGSMFYGMTSLETVSVSDKFVVGQVTSSSNMFYNTPNLVGGSGTLWNSSYVTKDRAHYDSGLYNPGYFNERNADRYNIIFDENGGHVFEKERYVWAGDEIGILPIPVRDGYVFQGWTYDIVSGIAIDNTYIPSSDMTLVAKWSKADAHTITFDPDGGSVSPRSIIVENGQPIRNLVKPSKTNQVFVGWYTDSSYTTKIENGYVPTSDMNLIAKWKDPGTLTITFNPNGGSINPGTISIVEDRVIGELPRPSWDNKHYFAGWYTGLTDGVYVTSTYVPKGNETLYARWTYVCTLTFDPNGGSVSPTSVDVVENVKIGNILPTPTKDFCEFNGWYTERIGGFYISNRDTLAGDRTAYARWTGWEFVNRADFDNPGEHLEEQEWAYTVRNNLIVNGWVELPDLYGVNKLYYFENGIAHIGWLHINGNHYFLSNEDDDGNGYVNCAAYRNETKVIDGRSYTFDANGKCTNY